jgi:pSer/pThr/pTyr-binding forkhead associated (FHA) protein
VIKGPLKGGVFVLSDLTIFEIGLNPGCHVQLKDPNCALNHARITHRSGKWQFQNLSEEKGSWINDIRVEHRPLESNDIIRIGASELQFGFTPPAAKKPAVGDFDSSGEEDEGGQGENRVDSFAGRRGYAGASAAPDRPATPPLPSPSDRPIRLVVIDGAKEDIGKELIADPRAVMLIGRSLNCDLVLKDGKISRTHCRVEMREGRLILTDLGSANGTVVNGEAVRKSVVNRGDYVRLGFTVLACRESEIPTGVPAK